MSYAIDLNSHDIEEINHLMKDSKSAKVYRRLSAIKMKSEGMANKDIARILGVNIDTVTDWIKIYISTGVTGLTELHLKNRRKSKIDIYIDELKKLVEKEPISTVAELQAYIKNNFGLEIEHSWLCRCCKKNSIGLIRRQG
jgi:transposase